MLERIKSLVNFPKFEYHVNEFIKNSYDDKDTGIIRLALRNTRLKTVADSYNVNCEYVRNLLKDFESDCLDSMKELFSLCDLEANGLSKTTVRSLNKFGIISKADLLKYIVDDGNSVASLSDIGTVGTFEIYKLLEHEGFEGYDKDSREPQDMVKRETRYVIEREGLYLTKEQQWGRLVYAKTFKSEKIAKGTCDKIEAITGDTLNILKIDRVTTVAFEV